MSGFTIGPTDRTLIVGRTGSGKSTLARAVFYGYRNLVVIDPKHEETLPRAAIAGTVADFRQLYPQRTTRVVFRPNPEDRRRSDVDEVIRRVLAYGSTCLLLHEAIDYAPAGWILPALRRAIKTGRTRGVPVVICSQRPVGLHNDVIAEAEHLFAFDLALRGDREKLAGIAGPGILEPPVGPFAFLYYGPATGGAVVRCDPLPAPAGAAPAAMTGGA